MEILTEKLPRFANLFDALIINNLDGFPIHLDKPFIIEFLQHPDDCFRAHAGEFSQLLPGQWQVKITSLKYSVGQAQQDISKSAKGLFICKTEKPAIYLETV